MFEKIKRFVELKLWTLDMITNVYKKNALTKEQYEELKTLL